MRLAKLNIEMGLYLLALLLAGFIRLNNLGAAALTDSEAALALQALNYARGQPPALLSPHPLYLALTTAGMFLFGASNWIARFWPALVGSLLVVTPWLFRRPLGRAAAVLLAFFLAIDPGLVAAARQAGSPVMALTGVLFAVGFGLTGRARLAGVCAGLALLAGPGIWQGALGLALAAWVFAAFLSRKGEETLAEVVTETEGGFEAPFQWRTAGWYALGTFLLAGSLFFFMPAGWSAAAQSLVAYVQSWVQPGDVPAVRVMQGLLFYGFLPAIAGLASAALFWEARAARFLAAWAAAALLLALLPPGRAVSGLVWVLPPLWGLSAFLAVRLFRRPSSERLPALGQALLSAVILGFMGLSAVGISADVAAARVQSANGLGLAAALVLLLLTALLVGWGWSWRAAGYGLAWSVAVVLLFLTLMTTWSASGLAGRPAAELWTAGPTIRDGDLLRQTIEDVSLWNTGARGQLEVVVVNIPSPALEWILRDQSKARYTSAVEATAAPDFVITAETSEPELGASYRGQDFILLESPVWNITGAQAWFRWLMFREIPMEARPVVLWARSDLFVGGQAQNQAAPGPDASAPEEPRQ